jgi:hypothetical protein
MAANLNLAAFLLKKRKKSRFSPAFMYILPDSAYGKAVGMKYRWAEGDTADLLGEIYSVRGDKAKGRKWLKKAVGCRKEILDPKVKETEGKLKKIKD